MNDRFFCYRCFQRRVETETVAPLTLSMDFLMVMEIMMKYGKGCFAQLELD